jgi:protein-tyrosine-phosphatase
MTREQKKSLSSDLPQHAGKIRTMGEFASTGEDVPDPYGGSAKDYERVAAQLDRLAALVLDRLK